MNAVNINMTLETSNFERLQSFIFEIDPNARIEVFSEKYFLNEKDLLNLKETIENVKNGTEKLYSSDEFKVMSKQKLKELGAL